MKSFFNRLSDFIFVAFFGTVMAILLSIDWVYAKFDHYDDED